MTMKATLNSPPTYTKITGYVGREYVTAFVYGGADAGLSHYTYQGKTYVGIVSFSTVNTTEIIAY